MSTITQASTPTSITTPATVVLAVAQTTTRQDPGDAQGFRDASAEIRQLMERARAAGADLIQFPEATFCFPDKRQLSHRAPEVGEADWSRFAWQALAAELTQVQRAARTLRLWTVVGAQTRVVAGERPHSSMLVIGPDGQVRARYDERRLSRTKDTHLYARGAAPATFEVNGIGFGLASGLEILFDDIFLAYEDAGVDAVLFSTQGPGEADQADSLATSARVAARHHQLTVGYSVPTSHAVHVPAGVVGPDGQWRDTCVQAERPDLVVTEVTARPEGGARDWRRSMVAGD